MSSLQKIIPYLLYLLLLLWGINDIFFWDTIQLGSKHAHFFFHQDLAPSFLPDEINSGHIPAFGYYLAICWKIFGKSLIVSHLAMLPFVLGIVYFAQKLISSSFSGPLCFLSLLVLLSDPTLVAQMGLVSPDVPLICFFLGTLYFKKHRANATYLRVILLVLLTIISMRGMFLVAAFFLFDWWVEKQGLKNLLKIYAPAVLLMLIFFLLHYLSKGWFAFHSDSPWGASFSMESLTGMIKKPAIILWRLLDFNRWFLILLGLYFAYRLFRADKKLYLINSDLYLLAIITIIFGLSGILFSGLTAHRYFLPINLLLAFYFIRMVQLSELKMNSKKIILICTSLILWTGHLLVYPPQIDQGWDASLAHKPYFSLRSQAENYIMENKLDKAEICSAFPDLAQGKYYFLDQDESAFQSSQQSACKYVLLSNVHNDIEPQDFEEYELIKEWKENNVWYRLLKR